MTRTKPCSVCGTILVTDSFGNEPHAYEGETCSKGCARAKAIIWCLNNIDEALQPFVDACQEAHSAALAGATDRRELREDSGMMLLVRTTDWRRAAAELKGEGS